VQKYPGITGVNNRYSRRAAASTHGVTGRGADDPLPGAWWWGASLWNFTESGENSWVSERWWTL